MQCLRTLQCDDRIVDLRYEVHGDVLALTLETSGTYLYANDGSFAALGSCRLPKPPSTATTATARPYVTAYASVLYRVYFEEEQRTRLQLNVLLATSDRRLLSFYVGVDKDPAARKKTKGTAAAAAAAAAATLSSGLRLETKLFGAFPLPSQVRLSLPLSLARAPRGRRHNAPSLSL